VADVPTHESLDPIVHKARERVGRVLRGKYRLDRLLGLGGMAAVYQATHTRNAGKLAIKVLHREISLDRDLRARFLREGYAANIVDHPGTVRVLDDDTAEDGSAFLVMELLDGETVDARWERSGRHLGVAEVVSIAMDLLDVLAAAHAKGVGAHRDVKPDNLFVTRDGRLKVLDFGIARLRDSSPTRTKSGAVFGTPAFMAPEQALGRVREIDAVTDVWAVGATCFALLTGRFVHEGETPEEMVVRAATTPAPSLANTMPSVPKPIANVIDRALAFDRSARWPSAAAMKDALARARDEVLPSIADDYDDDIKTRLGPPPQMTLPPSGPRESTMPLPTLPAASTVGGLTSDSGARGRRFVAVVGSALRDLAGRIHRLGTVAAMKRAGAAIGALAVTNAFRHRGRLVLTVASGLAVSFAIGTIVLIVARVHSTGSAPTPMTASASPEPSASADTPTNLGVAPEPTPPVPIAPEVPEPTPAATALPQPAPTISPTPPRPIATATASRTPLLTKPPHATRRDPLAP